MGRRSHRRVATLALLVTGLGPLSAPKAALACSICRCGDPTFNALGKEGFTAGGFRLALDWERFDKDEGDPAQERESQVENRFTALVSYGFSERFMLLARVPVSVRHLELNAPGQEPETVHTSGLSDPEVFGQLRLWASRMEPGLGRRTSLSVVLGAKTPWGQNDVQQEGERVDEHAQPGTGSTDVFTSLAFLHLIDAESALFVAGGYRRTGENDLGYRYGSSLLGNVAYEHKLGQRLDGVLELNFRHAREDRVAGIPDGDTGGSLLYLTPRLLANLGRGLVLRAGAQIPLVKDLNGFQKERLVANVGLTYLFSH